MDRFARIVVGYHGCKSSESIRFGTKLLLGEEPIEEWKPSENHYDWLGEGIYFWEHCVERAREWAGADGLVIGAVIQLGRCFDLTDVRYTSQLGKAFEEFKAMGNALPKNHAGPDLKSRDLDCAIINFLMHSLDAERVNLELDDRAFQTKRGAFEESEPAFPGSRLRKQTHIQVAVLDKRCILGVFRPNEGV